MSKARKMIVTGLGTGYLPVAPGTWASAAVCGLFLITALVSGSRTLCVTGTMLIVAAAASIACVALGSFAESAFGRKDPRPCTIDEWAGQAIALVLLPIRSSLPDWQSCLIAAGVAFFAFRIFDIFKPPPVRQIEKLPRGWGVLLDDLVAGIYANVVAQIVLRVILGW